MSCNFAPRFSLPDDLTACDQCVRGLWRDTLCNAANDFGAQVASFASHLDSLHTTQKRIHRLARKCTQARLYPNPISINTKPARQAQRENLAADLDFATRLHKMYFAAVNMYTLPVQAVLDSLKLSDAECRCTECARHVEQWSANTRTEIRLEAEGLMKKLKDMGTNFEKLEKDLLMDWEENGKDGLSRMIEALPEQKDLMNKPVVRKYFPRQIKEIEDAKDRTIRRSTIIGMTCKIRTKYDDDEGEGERI